MCKVAVLHNSIEISSGTTERSMYSYIIATSMEKKPAEQPMKIEMMGYEVVEKVAMPSGNTCRIYLPVDWKGKRVRAVRLEK